MILYLHDTPLSISNEIAANANNIDTIRAVESYLQQNNDVVLSADDGYKSVINLLPLLEKYNVKLLFFVTTGFIDKIVYPYEVELSNFLVENEQCIYEGSNIVFSTIEQKIVFYKSLHQKLKPMSLERRETFIEQFFQNNNTRRVSFQKNVFMDWNEIKEVANHPLVEIGSHCISHILLSTQSIKTVYRECKGSKERLQQVLGYKITKLSYPYGDNNLTVRVLAKITGYKEAYGTHNGKSTPMNIARSKLKELL